MTSTRLVSNQAACRWPIPATFEHSTDSDFIHRFPKCMNATGAIWHDSRTYSLEIVRAYSYPLDLCIEYRYYFPNLAKRLITLQLITFPIQRHTSHPLPAHRYLNLASNLQVIPQLNMGLHREASCIWKPELAKATNCWPVQTPIHVRSCSLPVLGILWDIA